VRRNAAVLVVATLCGCTTGQSNTTPPIISNPSTATPRLAVGTVNFASFAGTATGINVLEIFRGSNGYSAVPINTATLSGPPGFSAPPPIPGTTPDPGAGAAQIPLGSARNQFVIGSAGNGTILASADGFGMGPPSSSVAGQNFYPFQPQFALEAGLTMPPPQPSVFPGGPLPIYGGPPAYPPPSLVPSALSAQLMIPSGWAEGFYLVALTSPPPSGQYTLVVNYTANASNVATQATAQLGNQVLPFFNPPQIVGSGGGASVTVQLPPGVTEAIVNVLDANVPPLSTLLPANPSTPAPTPCPSGAAFTTLVFKQGGPTTQNIPANLGAGGAATFCSGDTLFAQGFGFDYDDVGLGPPSDTSPTPTLPAQADVTVSFPNVTQEQ
jgi:hypothetical protein